MNVPADFLYKTIIDSVLHDIKQATDQTLTEEQLEGYSYLKQFYKDSNATITIETVKKNQAYAFQTATKKYLPCTLSDRNDRRVALQLAL